jgi:hypothetical protein
MTAGEYADLVFYISNHTWTDSADKAEVCRLYSTDAAHAPSRRRKRRAPTSSPGSAVPRTAHPTTAIDQVKFGPSAPVDPGQPIAFALIEMAKVLQRIGSISVGSIVQLTDVEQECDGLLSYDRTSKFSPMDLKRMKASTVALVGTPIKCKPLVEAAEDKVMTGPARLPQWLTHDE